MLLQDIVWVNILRFLRLSVFNFETGLRLVAKRGELMSEASEGGMAAVIGLDEHHIKNTSKV